MAETLLPLFPLKVVLFPDTALPLHIFEERYKEMMGEVIDANGEFGVLCANENTVADVGCSARVARELRRYDDGRMDVLTTDEPADERQELKTRCLHLFQDLYESTPGHLPVAELEQVSTEVVSYYISYYSDLPLAKKQSLLELTSAEQRLLDAEEALKERMLAQGDDRERRRILRGNGHFPRE